MKNKNKKKVIPLKREEPHLDTNLENFPGEIWKDVIGYSGYYSVSNYGRVKSEFRYVSGRTIQERILRQRHNKLAQLSVALSIDGIVTSHNLTMLVGMAFIGDKNDKEIYCHKNKIVTDNRLENIIKVTVSESRWIESGLGYLSHKRERRTVQQYPPQTKKYFSSKNNIYKNGVLVGKRCTRCHKKLSLDDFYVNDKKTGSLRSECIQCNLQRKVNKRLEKRTNNEKILTDNSNDNTNIDG